MQTQERGFTLVELVIVLVIVGILASIAVPRYLDMTTDALAAARSGVMGGLNSALQIVHSRWIAQGATGTVTPDGGTATVAGCDLRTQSNLIRERIGYVGQAGGSDREITGRTELVFQGRLYGKSLDAAIKRAAELIEMLELEGAADRKTGTYSGGQKRRLDIGLGLVHDPQLLFLDEPTTGLDPQSRAALWTEVGRLAREDGVTVFDAGTKQMGPAISAAAAAIGPIERIVLGNAHADHRGGAPLWGGEPAPTLPPWSVFWSVAAPQRRPP